MDPLTHGVIGAAISAFSGSPVDFTNPITIGCTLGAMAPDLDVVTRIFGNDYIYCKHHRGISHSIPVLAGFALAISGLLMFVFPGSSFWSVFLWTFIGAISHTVFDILNSYGAKLFKRKKKASILMLYDPVITVMALFLILYRDMSTLMMVEVGLGFAFYITFRFWMKNKAYDKVRAEFSHLPEQDVTILPSLMAYHKWDYVVSTKDHNIVGQYNLLNNKVTERMKLERIDRDLKHLFDNTTLGKYFAEFTPNYHIKKTIENNKITLTAIDLRYYLKNNFMHHGTLTLDEDMKIEEAYFQPYKVHKKIPVYEDIA